MENIAAINIIFENGDNILINKRDFKNLYITNLTNKGEETPYEETIIKNKLYANFFMFKILTDEIDPKIINRIKNKKDINEIQVIFNNNKYIKFDIASNADPFNSEYNNDYEYILENENYLGVLLSEYKIKYLKNLFI